MSKRSKSRSRNQKRKSHTSTSSNKTDHKVKPSFQLEPLEQRILLSATWVGTDGDDVFNGTNDIDVAEGLDGADELHGGHKDDQLFGGAGDDVLYGEKHDDTLDGGAGNDQLFGGQGSDTLTGGGGHDILDGGKQDDMFRFTAVQNGDLITVDGGQHNDTIDLSGYGNSQISDNGSSMTIDMGGGQSFTVNYSDVETITTADGSYAPGGIPSGNGTPDAVDEAVSTTEDTAVTTGNVLANDTDPDGDALSITGFTQGANGTVVDNGDGTFTYTPDADFNGSDSFTYTVDDGDGGTATATVDVTVGAVNDAPTAVNDSVSTTEDTAVTTGNVLANDSDPDGDTLSITGFTQGANGTVVDNGDGTFTYTPDADFNGSDSFTYTVDDGNGETATATVDVTVGAVNDAPTAVNDSVSTTEDTAVTTGNVLANDSDPDGDTLSITGFTQGANGTVVDNGDGTFTYTPDADFNGSDSFTYTVDDGNGGTDTATVNVTVNAAGEGSGNSAPDEVNDPVTTDEDTPATTDTIVANDLQGDLNGTGDDLSTPAETTIEHSDNPGEVLDEQPAPNSPSHDVGSGQGDTGEAGPGPVSGQGSDPEDTRPGSEPNATAMDEEGDLDVLDPTAEFGRVAEFDPMSQEIREELERTTSVTSQDDAAESWSQDREVVSASHPVGRPADMLSAEATSVKGLTSDDVYEEVELPVGGRSGIAVGTAATRVLGATAMQTDTPADQVEPIVRATDGPVSGEASEQSMRSRRGEEEQSGNLTEREAQVKADESGLGPQQNTAASASALGGLFARLLGVVRGLGGAGRRSSDHTEQDERQGRRL